MRVGLYYVRGLRARRLEIVELFERGKLYILAVNETFMEKERSIGLALQSEAICNDKAASTTHPPGGTAIPIRPGIKYELLEKNIFRRTELVVVRAGVLTVGVIYAPPRAPWTGLEQALERFRELTSGKGILIGDLNARHHSWCSRQTSRGRMLHAWASRHRLDISAPPYTTHRNSNGTELTIDLAIVKSGRLRNLDARMEWQQPFNGSDHAPLVMEWWGKTTWMRNNDKRVHKNWRRDEDIVALAGRWFDDELGWNVEAMRAEKTQQDLDLAYEAAVRCWLRPWNRARARERPRRWGPLWSRELQQMT